MSAPTWSKSARRRFRRDGSNSRRADLQQHAPQQRRRDGRRSWVQSAHECVGLRRPKPTLRLGLSDRCWSTTAIRSACTLSDGHPTHTTAAEHPGNNFATVVPGGQRAVHHEPGHAGLVRLRPQGRLRLPDAAADQSQGTCALAACPVQVDSLSPIQRNPLADKLLRVAAHVDRSSDGWQQVRLTSACRRLSPSSRCRAWPGLRRKSDRSEGSGNRPRV